MISASRVIRVSDPVLASRSVLTRMKPPVGVSGVNVARTGSHNPFGADGPADQHVRADHVVVSQRTVDAGGGVVVAHDGRRLEDCGRCRRARSGGRAPRVVPQNCRAARSLTATASTPPGCGSSARSGR